jgi:hypothetical protein
MKHEMGGETVEDKNTMMWTTNEGEKFTKEILKEVGDTARITGD